ncbi:peptidase family M20/M25/M40 protein [Hirsutella rhossiliensis]|uniref:Peptidase family M20/M25/M40 protein n=1 Tax=Hirsutella rhossiliensis TaxID=111463 RepID=A0A9P8N6S2_9HYPO|nr:peptidase family M20/M25/M40 protein [Hirsutella rhossiliensis]KAH0965682.1 peptidase family M20/M25/M40 protein [Hirsutella rhossiliensis]
MTMSLTSLRTDTSYLPPIRLSTLTRPLMMTGGPRPAIPFRQLKTANWSMPPLFKAFPQAVRHVILPAATISADAILRLNEKRQGMGLAEEAAVSAQANGLGSRGEKDKDKKKHRRLASASAESLEWTTKIFVLVTSGYLLQYAGDGHFDRMPEKILRLGPSSAAFATDAIPGRHWVVRVSSTAEADGTPAPESRSLFSKLPFRIDRRNTSNLLMVFESAEVMETWITALRGEIERLGGKKNLSETGRPKTMESSQPFPERHSKRALMAKSLPRLRSPGPNHHGINHATAPRLRGANSGDGPNQIIGPDAVDDDSTSNSGLSQDERQLDNLREHSNRLSLGSSGQRTMVTSAGPSPEASPTREHLTPPADEMHARPGEAADVVVKPRPNASDISIRRQSVQVAAPFIDPGQQDQAEIRSPSAAGLILRSDGAVSPLGLHPTPNFSVPHSSNRRFSHTRASPVEAESSPSLEPSRLARGKPPPALRATRTLSIVMDQPPLREAGHQRPVTAYRGNQLPSPTKERAGSVGANWTQNGSATRTGRSVPPRRRQEPVGGLRSPPLTPRDHDMDRYQSSFLDPSTPQSRSYGSPHSTGLEGVDDESHVAHEARNRRSVAPGRGTLSSSPTGRIHPHASSPYLKVQMTEKALLNRRSMPQLTEGPPPAPPPTRALPPIPQNLALRA